jgi:hypothetical protein
MRSIITVRIKKISDIKKKIAQSFTSRNMGKNDSPLKDSTNHPNKTEDVDEYPDNAELLEKILDVNKWKHKRLAELKEKLDNLNKDLLSKSEEDYQIIKDEIAIIQDKIKIITKKYLKVIPEDIKIDEYDSEIFCGYLMDNKTRVSITRLNDCEATIRLSNSNLKKLQESTTDFVKSILKSDAISLSRNEIEIYEKKELNILLSGKIIPQSFQKFWLLVIKKDLKSALLVVFLSLSSILLFLIIYRNLFLVDDMTKDITGRIFTGFITTDAVAILSLIQTAFEISNKVIKWSVEGDELD